MSNYDIILADSGDVLHQEGPHDQAEWIGHWYALGRSFTGVKHPDSPQGAGNYLAFIGEGATEIKSPTEEGLRAGIKVALDPPQIEVRVALVYVNDEHQGYCVHEVESGEEIHVDHADDARAHARTLYRETLLERHGIQHTELGAS